MKTPPDQRETFTWYAHPARERWPATVGAALVIAALAVLTGWMMASLWWGLLAAVVLVVALNRYFFVSRFSIDEEGLTARYPIASRRVRWVDLTRFAIGPKEGVLFTRSPSVWFDRGVHVLFGRQPEEVRDHLAAMLPEGGGAWAS